MSEYRMPECIDIANAPERASLGILLAALHAVEGALYAEHPTLVFADLIEPGWPPTLVLAKRLIHSCDKLQRLIDKYDRAVDDALGRFSDEPPF